MPIKETITLVLMIVGIFFMAVGAVGLVRLPDLYMRMSATTKSATLGVGFMLVAAAVYFSELGTAIRVIATIAFLLLTAPVAAHMIGRAAYIRNVELWPNTRDELRGQYDLEREILAGSPPKLRDDLPRPVAKNTD